MITYHIKAWFGLISLCLAVLLEVELIYFHTNIMPI